jgi:AcrR family transcriptional regulator
MARNPERRTPQPPPHRKPSPGGASGAGATSGGAPSDRDRIIAAFMSLLAETPFEEIGFAEIAAGAGVSLADLRGEFGSKLAILAAYIKGIDRKVLAGGDADLAEEPPRERLFDVLMRRLEALVPERAAIRSLMRSARRNTGLALALNGMAVTSQQWMLAAANIETSGPKGMVRAQGMALLFARVLRTFVHDDDTGLARTMAALDRALARGQRWSGFLDDLWCLTPRGICLPGFRRRRHRDHDDQRDRHRDTDDDLRPRRDINRGSDPDGVEDEIPF